MDKLTSILVVAQRTDADRALLDKRHLIDRADLLSEFPELGTPYRKHKDVRRLRCDPYFIYYRVRSSQPDVKGYRLLESEILSCDF